MLHMTETVQRVSGFTFHCMVKYRCTVSLEFQLNSGEIISLFDNTESLISGLSKPVA